MQQHTHTRTLKCSPRMCQSSLSLHTSFTKDRARRAVSSCGWGGDSVSGKLLCPHAPRKHASRRASGTNRPPLSKPLGAGIHRVLSPATSTTGRKAAASKLGPAPACRSTRTH